MDPVILEARPMLVHISHRNQAISSTFPIQTIPSGKQLVSEGRFLFIEIFQQIHQEERALEITILQPLMN